MKSTLVASLVLATFAAAACSATKSSSQFDDSGTGGGSDGSTASGTGGIDLSTSSSSGAGAGVLGEEPKCDGISPDVDNDGDGFTGAQGDCNDCTAQMNPGAYDYPGNNIDEDCNGAKDDEPTHCDMNLPVGSTDAMNGAQALDLCKIQQGAAWGVKSADYVTADGQPLTNYDPQGLGHGLLGKFGSNVKPQEGQRMLVLSSGAARTPSDPGYQDVQGYDKYYMTGSPPGYPKDSPACPGVSTGEPHDSAGLRVVIKTPTNAKSLKFNLDFYTFEFPNFICSEFNDFFVAMMTPKPAGQPDGNISFDSKGNTISVNAGFLQVCTPQQASNGQPFACALGTSQLQGTGFDQDTNSAATGWLQTTSPVPKPGDDITLLFAIWDSGDGILDSTVLLDNFSFDVTPAKTETQPLPPPK